MDPPCPRLVRDPPLCVSLCCGVSVRCVFKIFVGVSQIWALRRTTSARPPPKMGRHTTSRELQTCTFEGSGFQSHHQFHETTPKRGRKNENSGGRGKRKREILGPHPSGPQPSGAPPFGDPLRDPPPPDSPHCFWGFCLCCFAPDSALLLLFMVLLLGRRPSIPFPSHLYSV